MQTSLKLLLFFGLTITSCITNDQSPETKTETQISPEDALQKVDTSQKQLVTKKLPLNNDTLTIDSKSAVFYQPDSLQMEKRMREVGEENFRAGADDYIYYVNTSADYLEKQGATVIDAKNKKYLRFIMDSNKVQLVKLDTLEELWGIYLFNPNKKPYPADMTMMEEEYNSYFK